MGLASGRVFCHVGIEPDGNEGEQNRRHEDQDYCGWVRDRDEENAHTSNSFASNPRVDANAKIFRDKDKDSYPRRPKPSAKIIKKLERFTANLAYTPDRNTDPLQTSAEHVCQSAP